MLHIERDNQAASRSVEVKSVYKQMHIKIHIRSPAPSCYLHCKALVVQPGLRGKVSSVLRY